MSARPARRIARPQSSPAEEQARRRALEHRRRRHHFARRRRDLLEDTVAALALTILAISITAGLGVIALFEAPLALLLCISYLLDCRARRRARYRLGGRFRCTERQTEDGW